MARMSYGRAFAWHAERDPDAVAVMFGDAAASLLFGTENVIAEFKG